MHWKKGIAVSDESWGVSGQGDGKDVVVARRFGVNRAAVKGRCKEVGVEAAAKGSCRA